jgi:TonB family protein
MRRVRAVSGVALSLLFASAAWADCVRPQTELTVPDGSTATNEQMLAAQQRIVAHANAVSAYVHCMQGEYGQKSIGQDEATRAKLNEQYTNAHAVIANEVTGLAACYQEQVERFQASGGGNQVKTVNCAAHIEAAGKRTTTSARSAEELVIEASGYSYDLPTGLWRFLLARDESARSCAPGAAEQCFYRAVLVLNESNETLECSGEIAYDGVDLSGKAKTQAKALVMPRTTRIIAASLALDSVNASQFDATCAARPALPPLSTPASCKYKVEKPVAIGDYYPTSARAAGEEGPVTVEFTLAGAAGAPKNVRAVASSMYPALDEAAVKAVGDMVMSSSCPNATYRLRLNFQLQ